MSFNTLPYIVFLTLTWAVFATAGKRSWRLGALLAASLIFYASWNPGFTLLLLAASAFNHGWGKVLRKRGTPGVLWVGLSVNIGLLFSLKYAPALLEAGGRPLDFLAPIGVSFYTFQAISYLMEVYRGDETEPGWVEFFLYMSFWPTILSGPICRIPEMVPQFRSADRPSVEDVSVGFRRIVLGLFMKVVVADTLGRGLTAGTGVNAGFDPGLASWSRPDVLFLCIGYGFQIFFDFAGYSHAAIGSARLFGLRLRENFDRPFLATTISEFWNRWHMSLSSWIRDYLFFPLATLRSGTAWRLGALTASMTIFGLWHGAAATFVLWGFYHGLLLAAHRLLQQMRRRRSRRLPPWIADPLSGVATFAAVTLGWTLFRAANLAQTSQMIRSLWQPAPTRVMEDQFYFLVALVAGAYFVYAAARKLLAPLLDSEPWRRLAWYATPVWNTALILLVVIWSDASSPFVYVRF